MLTTHCKYGNIKKGDTTMDEKNYEVIDLTEQDQVDYTPEIGAIEEPNGEGENPETVEAVETVEEIEEPEEEPAVEAAVEEEIIDAGGTTEEEETPVPEDPIAARITALESQIDILVDKLNVIVSTVSNIEDMEKKRAAGPQGFFKPVPDGSEPGKADLPRIERIYK